MLSALLALSLSSVEVPMVEAAEPPKWTATVATSLWTGQSLLSAGLGLERAVGAHVSVGLRVDAQAAQVNFAGQPSNRQFRVDLTPLGRWYFSGSAPAGVWMGAELPCGFISGTEVGGFTVGGTALIGYSHLFESGLTAQISAGPSLRYFSQRGALTAQALQAGVGGTLAFGYAW